MSIVLAAALTSAPMVQLVCQGGGNRRSLYDSQQYGETIRVEITETGGRIQLPPAMLPPELYGGDGGWYRLRSFTKTATTYSARVKVNFINSPTVLIDRVVGTIRIDGGQSGFSGTCETVDGNAEAKF